MTWEMSPQLNRNNIILTTRILIVIVTVYSRICAQKITENEIARVNTCGCSDKQTEPYGCDIQKSQLQSCNSSWLIDGDYCAFTCGRCLCNNGCMCTNYSPNIKYTCEELSYFGKCSEPWMVVGEYCMHSCGRCDSNCQIDESSYVDYSENSLQNNDTSVMQIVFDLSLQVPASESLSNEADEELIPQSLNADTYALPYVYIQPLRRSQSNGQEISSQQFIANNCTQDLLSILDKYTELQYMKNLIQENPLLEFYELQSRSQPLTWFVPTQTSILDFVNSLGVNDIFNNQVNMWQLFSGHIVPGYFTEDDLVNIGSFSTLLPQMNVSVYRDDQTGMVTVSDQITEAYIIKADLRTCVSIIHVLDGVIVHKNSALAAFVPTATPSPAQDSQPQIPSPQQTQFQLQEQLRCSSPLDVIYSNPQFKVAQQLIQLAEIEPQLNQTQTNLTIFLPTNFSDWDMAALLGIDAGSARQLLLYHIVPNLLLNITEANGFDLQLFTLLSGLVLKLSHDEEGTMLKGISKSARIVEENYISSCTAVIHIIDQFTEPYPQLLASTTQQVLPSYRRSTRDQAFIPSPTPQCYLSAWEFILSQKGLSILQEITQVHDWLIRPELNVTVFIPDSDSLDYIASISKLLSSPLESAAQIAYDLMLYHIVQGVRVPQVTSNQLSQGSKQKYDTMASGLPIFVDVETSQYGYGKMVVQGIGQSATVVNTRSQCPGNGLQVHYLDGMLLPFQSENMGVSGLLQESEGEENQDDQDIGQNFYLSCNSNRSALDYVLEAEAVSKLVSMVGDSIYEYVNEGSSMATYFLPTNDAIETLLQIEGIIDTFGSERNLGMVILQYHTLLNLRYGTNSIIHMQNRRTSHHLTKFNGLSLAIQKIFGSLLIIGEASVARLISLEPFSSCNAVVHLIDTVLLPFPVSNSSGTIVEPQVQAGDQAVYGSFEASTGAAYIPYAVNTPLEFVQPEAVRDGQGGIDSQSSYLNTQQMVVQTEESEDTGTMYGADSMPPPIFGDSASASTLQAGEGCDISISSWWQLQPQDSSMRLAFQYFLEAGFGQLFGKQNADFTIFAPVNEAFDQKLERYNMSLTQMRNDANMHEQFMLIMSYHIVNVPVSGNMPIGSRGIFGTEAFDDDGYRLQIKMTKYMKPYALQETIQIEGMVNNATVSGPSFRVCNAYIYPIDQVLSVIEQEEMVLPPSVIQGSASEHLPSISTSDLIPQQYPVTSCIKSLHQIQNQADLTIFNTLIHYSGLSQVLDLMNNITIFAPVDEGLLFDLEQSFGLSDVSEISNIERNVMESWLAYHIAEGLHDRQSLKEGQQLQSKALNQFGETLNFTILFSSTQIYVQGGNEQSTEVLRFDIQACNAILHLIAAPLFP
eukprot:TRINITY_DN96_c0_g1_i1.p1 TRINITY_DN96_c0_g1~~TRINITY_DN96_c0_g1_i1.p1  ORF type:complete len:1371 (+),score=157.95 TRINITY_DN96_c0_g1_i1:299-4411(+)